MACLSVFHIKNIPNNIMQRCCTAKSTKRDVWFNQSLESTGLALLDGIIREGGVKGCQV